MVKYILYQSVAAQTSDRTITEIPAGAVVEAPAMLVAKGTVQIRYKNRQMTVLAMDLLDSARIVPGEQG
jgi:hypothetical protein